MKLIFSWVGILLCSMVYSQTLTIVDKETGQPVEFATVASQQPEAYTITNAKGQTDISNFQGAENIEIRSVGYKTLQMSYSELREVDFILRMDRANFNLDEVVVSATRWKQTTGNVPSKIISIGSKEIELQNPQTAADLLNVSGKVYVQKSQQGGGSPMIRGFATNRLLYTVDGIRMNTAIFRGGNIQNVINLDPFATENTEVLFGPGSTIYGSDAIGGVMSFTTLTPQLSASEKTLITGKGVARYSSANQERTGHFDINLGWEKWAAVTSFSKWDYDHLKQGSNGPEDYVKSFFVRRQDGEDQIIQQKDELLQRPSAYSQFNLMQKIRYTPNSKWDVRYGFHYSETSSYGRYDRHNRTRDGEPRYGQWDYGPQKWIMNNLTVTHEGKKRMYDDLTIRLAHQLFEESRISRNFNSPEREIREENVEAYSVNLDMVKYLTSRNSLFYGIEWVRNDVTSTGTIENIQTGATSPGPSRYPQSDWTSLALYINDEYRVSDNLTLQGGLRYNQFLLNADFQTDFYPFPFSTANINSGALTGSVGGVYRPNDYWVMSMNFGTAFRSPNVDDIGKIFDSEPGAVTVPNPDLQAEYAYNLDLGVVRVVNDFLKLDLTGYYTILNNALVRRDFRLNGMDSILYDGVNSQVQALQNAATARVYGLQAGVEMKFPEGFSLTSDINYQVGEEELDDGRTSPSRHAAPLFGVTRLSYKRRDLTIQIYSMYQGERSFEDLAVEERNKDEIYAKDKNGNNYSPSWYTLNLKTTYQLTDFLNLNGGVENITDQRYRPYSSGISGAGRNFILSVTANF